MRAAVYSFHKKDVSLPFQDQFSMHLWRCHANSAYRNAVKEQRVYFLTVYNFLNPSQHDLFRSRSYLTCQFDFLNLATQSAESHRPMLVFLLDMPEAYNRVFYSRLLAKIRS